MSPFSYYLADGYDANYDPNSDAFSGITATSGTLAVVLTGVSIVVSAALTGEKYLISYQVSVNVGGSMDTLYFVFTHCTGETTYGNCLPSTTPSWGQYACTRVIDVTASTAYVNIISNASVADCNWRVTIVRMA